MPTAPLPENPSLEHLKSQAKLVRDLIRAGDQGALGMVDEFHPRLDSPSLDESALSRFKTTDAQLIVARMYRFASWPQLRAHLEIVTDRSFTPTADDAELSPVDAFVTAACLDYSEDGPRPEIRLAEAHRMLADDPSLATRSIAALATVGDEVGLRAALNAEPGAVNAPCGPNQWTPLLYATFSRIDNTNPAWSAIETVRSLIELGADPNTGFLWKGLVPPFTALTGALGGGESRQPWRTERLAIARLLLEAGADPNDGQGLYNNGVGGQNDDNPAHLELLVEYGLGTQQNGPWYQQLGDQLREPAELLYDELEAAAKRNRPAVLRYLLSLGLDSTRPIGRSQLPPARIAAAEGHDLILEELAKVGIDVEPTPAEAALSYARTDNIGAFDTLLAEHPDLLEELQREHPALCNNVSAGHTDMLRRLVELGFDINDRSTTKTPLHHAAEAGDTNRARVLIEHGADPNLNDTHIGATPWGWANHFGHTDAANYLHPLTHHGDPLPEITIHEPQRSVTLASPNLIAAYLEKIHRAGQPILATLQHGRAALTIGLGQPPISVALYLDNDGAPWHAKSNNPPDPGPETEWTGRNGPTAFYPTAYLEAPVAVDLAAEFVAEPTVKPKSVDWEREGGI